MVANLHRATTAVRNHLEQTVLRDPGLTYTGFVVLRVVWTEGELETGRAAAEAGISKGTLTGVVKTLESCGLVGRHPHPTDGRRVLLRISSDGRKLMKKLSLAVNKQEAFALSDLSQRQRKEVTASLATIVDRLDARPAPA
jgi:DNA-binding MarR family transcriptional regulator